MMMERVLRPLVASTNFLSCLASSFSLLIGAELALTMATIRLEGTVLPNPTLTNFSKLTTSLGKMSASPCDQLFHILHLLAQLLQLHLHADDLMGDGGIRGLGGDGVSLAMHLL